MLPPQASSSTLRQGVLAQQLLAMQQERNKAQEERKIAILEAKYEAQLRSKKKLLAGR
jgi:hypothetical protein